MEKFKREQPLCRLGVIRYRVLGQFSAEKWWSPSQRATLCTLTRLSVGRSESAVVRFSRTRADANKLNCVRPSLEMTESVQG